MITSSKAINKKNYWLQLVAIATLFWTIAFPNTLAEQLATLAMFGSLIIQRKEKRGLPIPNSDGTPNYCETETTPSEEEKSR